MKSIAEKARSVWDEIYSAETALAPRCAQTGIFAVDEALDWLCEGAKSVIDFGCGNGTMLFLCALRGTQRHTGIDFSPSGIRLAKKRAALLKLGRYRFITGGIEKLDYIGGATQDAAILSNIADNLAPHDAQHLLSQIRRVVRPGGRVFIKLNPYIDANRMRECGIRVTSGDLLDGGLLLFNLPTEKWAALLRGLFIIEGCTEAYYPKHEQLNRIFTLLVPPRAKT